MTMQHKKPIIVTQELRKSYPAPNGDLEVLKGIDLTIYEGEIIAIVGSSGVGKSTLLHLLGALDRPTSGEVILDNTPLPKLTDSELAKFRNKNIGFVFQFHHLLPEFTALENVAMPALIANSNGRNLHKHALSLLEDVGVDHRSSHRPSELSGGEQQRVAVARALMNQPATIMADEPSGNLDRLASENLHQLLWNLCKKHKQTFVIVTHNMQLAGRADRIIELYDGRIHKIHTNDVLSHL